MMKPVRDVMADAFDSMPGGELRGYDVADRLMRALANAGYEIVPDESHAFIQALYSDGTSDGLER